MGEGLQNAPVKVAPHLFNKTLFRAVRSEKVETPLGMHWSRVSGLRGDEDPSGRFDTTGSGASMFNDNEDKKGSKSTIIHGKVNENAIVNLRSPEGKRMAGRHQIWEGGHPEYEKTVRPGANVLVTGLTRTRVIEPSSRSAEGKYIPPKTKDRKITYKKPRQVQA